MGILVNFVFIYWKSQQTKYIEQIVSKKEPLKCQPVLQDSRSAGSSEPSWNNSHIDGISNTSTANNGIYSLQIHT